MSVTPSGRGPVTGQGMGQGIGPGIDTASGYAPSPGSARSGGATADTGQGRPPLDPGVLELIRWSAGWLSRRPDDFVDHLQADIATLIPDLAPGGRAFCERMVHAMLWVALTDDPPRAVAGSLRWVGTMNYLDGFPEAQYVNVAHALVRAVHDLTEMHWSTSVGSAWISYFMWIRPYLAEGAQQAAAQQAAQQAGQRAARQAAEQAATWQATRA